MAVKSNILDIQYFSEYANGTNFANNLTDFTRNLAASVMERIKVVSTYSIGWNIEYIAPAGQASAFEWGLNFAGDLLTITRTDGGNFREEGFAVGQLVRWRSFTTVAFEKNVTVFSILEEEMTLDMDGTTALPFAPGGIQIIGLEPLEALLYDFGLIENDENYNNISKVTENSTSYYGSEIGLDTGGGRSTAFVDLIPLGQFEDFISGSARARFVQNIDEVDMFFQIFEVEHIITVNPWYLDGGLQDLQNNILPDFLEGSNSLKYVLSSRFRQVLNNPNIEYAIQVDDVLGSVAWFNESFNGFQNGYEVLSVDYEEDITAAAADGILVAGRTKIIITAQSTTSFTLGPGDTFGVYISYLPLEEDYKGTEDTNLLQNFIYDRAINEVNASATAGLDFIKDLSASESSGVITIECIVEYSAAQRVFLANRLAEDNGKYVLGVQLGDDSRSSGNSDRLIIKADVRDYDESPDIPGLVSISDFLIYPHNELIGTGTGFTNMISWNEDGLVCDFNLNLDLNKQAFFNNLGFVLIAYNPTTENFFILDSYQVDLSSVIVSGGIQQINVDTERGYTLQNNSQFNQVQVNTGTNTAGVQQYVCRYAQKISWQDWIQNLGVDSVFFDSAEPNDNLNLKSSNYSDENDYTIRLGVRTNVSGVSDLGVSGDTDYLLISPEITVHDYGEDGNVTPEWSGEISTIRESNGEDLGGAVLTGENTIMRTVWTNSIGPVGSLDDIWAIHRIEETGDPGFNIEELSSLRNFPPGQLLIPISGSPLLEISLGTGPEIGKVITRCLIDGSEVNPSRNYNLSARIHNSTALTLNFKVTSPASEIKDTSGTVEPKIEAELP